MRRHPRSPLFPSPPLSRSLGRLGASRPAAIARRLRARWVLAGTASTLAPSLCATPGGREGHVLRTRQAGRRSNECGSVSRGPPGPGFGAGPAGGAGAPVDGRSGNLPAAPWSRACDYASGPRAQGAGRIGEGPNGVSPRTSDHDRTRSRGQVTSERAVGVVVPAVRVVSAEPERAVRAVVEGGIEWIVIVRVEAPESEVNAGTEGPAAVIRPAAAAVIAPVPVVAVEVVVGIYGVYRPGIGSRRIGRVSIYPVSHHVVVEPLRTGDLLDHFGPILFRIARPSIDLEPAPKPTPPP